MSPQTENKKSGGKVETWFASQPQPSPHNIEVGGYAVGENHLGNLSTCLATSCIHKIPSINNNNTTSKLHPNKVAPFHKIKTSSHQTVQIKIKSHGTHPCATI